MPAARYYDDPCGIARALDVIGDRWALLVVRELIFGPKRFVQLRSDLRGISPNVLAQRLRFRLVPGQDPAKVGESLKGWMHDHGYDDVELELMAEAVRNPKVADALRGADELARRQTRELLTGPRGTLRHCDADELESRIEVLFALFGGMRIRALKNPALKRGALIAVLLPVMRMLLTPGD